MHKIIMILLTALSSMTCVSQTLHDDISPVPFTNVHINDGFWSQRLDTMRNKTIRYAFRRCEEAGYMRNFELAGKILSGELKKGEAQFQSGSPFDDADLFKIIEGAAYILSVKEDPEFEKYIDSVIDKIVAAQEPDGYLFTNRTIGNPVHDWVGTQRWVNDWNLSHETFNAGELYEAAVAYYAATGKDKLLRAAVKNADLVCKVYNDNGLKLAPGHAVIEMALARMYETTGDSKYLDLCKFFIDCRGQKKFDSSSSDIRTNGMYWQNHLPATEQREAVGHAVRALYFYSGMADAILLGGHKEYVEAINAIWENIVSKKLYITGGLGAREDNEAFGGNYELPNARAYCETCAGLANCMFNLRMFRLYGDSRYIDVLERSLYNNVLSGISVTGDMFFYPNRLEASSRGQQRSEWFGCSCCPTNLARFIPSVPGYAYATGKDAVYVNLFIAGKADISLGKRQISLTQQTEYPWEGNVRLSVDKAQKSDFCMKIRIPGWAQGRPVPSDLYNYEATSTKKTVIKVNGRPYEYDIDHGYAVIQRKWKAGDTVEIEFPMEPRIVTANAEVKADRGLIAVERGPIVYCAEFADNGGTLQNLYIPRGASLKVCKTEGIVNGMRTIIAQGRRCSANAQNGVSESAADVTLIPYMARAHRGAGEMKVWMPTDGKAIMENMDYIDKVVIADETSEREHNLQGQNMRSDASLGWRDALDGWISYDMTVDPQKTNEVVLTYWGSDAGNREFDIMADGTPIGRDRIENCMPYEYYDVRHIIPQDITKGKKKVTIMMKSLPGKITGGIFGIKTTVKE